MKQAEYPTCAENESKVPVTLSGPFARERQGEIRMAMRSKIDDSPRARRLVTIRPMDYLNDSGIWYFFCSFFLTGMEKSVRFSGAMVV